jgi:hypothetical protein
LSGTNARRPLFPSKIVKKNLTEKSVAMASSSKSKGSVRTLQWWKHLRDWKRPQNKRVRSDGKKQIEQAKKEEL